MPNIKSAKKRCGTSLLKEQRNRAVKSQVRTTRRAFLESIQAHDLEQSRSRYRAFCSAIDKAVKKGILQANVSNRGKSRLMSRLNAMG